MGDSTLQRDTGDDWEARLAEYAFGVLPPAELADFERGLEECRAHIARADEYVSVVGALGMAVRPFEPPTGHKQRFLSRLASTAQEAPHNLGPAGPVPSPEAISSGTTAAQATTGDMPAEVTDLAAYRERRRAFGLFPAATALVAVLLVAVGLWALVSLQQQKEQLNIPPSYAPFTIKGQGPNPNAYAVGFVNKQTNEVTLVAQNLPQLGANEVYELWWVPPGFPNTKPVAAGTFNANEAGEARHTAHSADPVTAFVAVAVTKEPAPGGTTAKGPIVLIGSFQTP